VRVAIFAAAVLLALLVETTVLPAVAVATFRPDLLVLLVVGVALVEGPDSGLRLGFAAGLAQDLVGGGQTLVGLGALVLMAVGWAAGRGRPYIAASRRSGPIALTGVLAAGATVATGLLERLFGVLATPVPRVLLGALVVGVYTAVVAAGALRAVQGLVRQFPPPSLAG
jgi:rod shape-determining protein MreD